MWCYEYRAFNTGMRELDVPLFGVACYLITEAVCELGYVF